MSDIFEKFGIATIEENPEVISMERTPSKEGKKKKDKPLKPESKKQEFGKLKLKEEIMADEQNNNQKGRGEVSPAIGQPPTLQDAIDNRLLKKHYKDPFTMAGEYAQAALGYGEFQINLDDPEEVRRFEIAQRVATLQQNDNNGLHRASLMDSYRFRGNPQFVSFSQWENMMRARENAQLSLKIDQQARDNAYMKTHQMEEQIRKTKWMDYNYGNATFI